MTYAKDTEVSSDRSRAEIERTLAKYGATKFIYAWQETSAVIGFEMRDRRVRFMLPLPDPKSKQFIRTPTGRERATKQAQDAYEQAVRQRWRALALAIKAKLESVESGIEQFEEAFLAQIVTPNGQTVGEYLIPQLPEIYQGKPPSLLPPGRENL